MPPWLDSDSRQWSRPSPFRASLEGGTPGGNCWSDAAYAHRQRAEPGRRRAPRYRSLSAAPTSTGSGKTRRIDSSAAVDGTVRHRAPGARADPSAPRPDAAIESTVDNAAPRLRPRGVDRGRGPGTDAGASRSIRPGPPRGPGGLCASGSRVPPSGHCAAARCGHRAVAGDAGSGWTFHHAVVHRNGSGLSMPPAAVPLTMVDRPTRPGCHRGGPPFLARVFTPSCSTLLGQASTVMFPLRVMTGRASAHSVSHELSHRSYVAGRAATTTAALCRPGSS
jgi:hypothetical protein